MDENKGENIETVKNFMCPEYDKPATVKLIYEQLEDGSYKLVKMACKLEMEMSFRGTQCYHSCEKKLKEGE
jgi:predicted transcriptional regulator